MAQSLRPIGILGGTFDPVHYGHLRLAEEAADACCLERVVLIPAALPNLRAAPATPAVHRLAMTRLAAEGNARLVVDDRELKRHGTSYTVDTLTELRTELGAERSLCLILGADAFLRLPAWSRWLRLFELCHVVVAARPGYDVSAKLVAADELNCEWSRRNVTELTALAARPAGAIARMDIPLLEISASDLRARMSQGRSIRYLLPSAVADHIAAHRLYGVQ
jgi:nicotinate-nucleotide adenylyltransferase